MFLVEGESDEVSFEGLLKDFFSSYDIHIHIMRCDITIADNPAPSEILAKLKEPQNLKKRALVAIRVMLMIRKCQ